MRRSLAVGVLLFISYPPDLAVADSEPSHRISRVPVLAQSEYPRWSPDGNRIAFMSNRDGNFEIYVMRSDGSDLTRLTHSLYQELFPTWSPDGATVAFTSARDGHPEIYVMDVGGSNVERLTFSRGRSDLENGDS